jgi:hypothetical protein
MTTENENKNEKINKATSTFCSENTNPDLDCSSGVCVKVIKALLKE